MMNRLHVATALSLGITVMILPGCGGSSPAAPPPATIPPTTTLPPAPATLADLSATVTSPQTDASINCTDEVHARVTLTNRAASGVVVLGVLNSSGIPAGDCAGGGDFTFRPLTRLAAPKSTTVVLDQSLYANGPGCCLGKGCGGSCRFQEAFQVITELGNVPAGAFNYKVFFQNCQSCP